MLDPNFRLPHKPLHHRIYNLLRLEILNQAEGQQSAHVYDLYLECYHEAMADYWTCIRRVS